jgi:hypothetical protein
MTTTMNPERIRVTPIPSTILTDTWYLTGRKLRALARQAVVLAMGVIQPVVWLFPPPPEGTVAPPFHES